MGGLAAIVVAAVLAVIVWWGVVVGASGRHGLGITVFWRAVRQVPDDLLPERGPATANLDVSSLSFAASSAKRCCRTSYSGRPFCARWRLWSD